MNAPRTMNVYLSPSGEHIQGPVWHFGRIGADMASESVCATYGWRLIYRINARLKIEAPQITGWPPVEARH